VAYGLEIMSNWIMDWTLGGMDVTGHTGECDSRGTLELELSR